MISVISIQDVYVIREKPVYTTAEYGGMIYPIRIDFTKDISDEKLRQIAAVAKLIQDEEGGQS